MMRPETQEMKLRIWEERVIDCRSSGKSVRNWCKEHSIDYSTYFRWEKQVLETSRTKAGNKVAFLEQAISRKKNEAAKILNDIAGLAEGADGKKERMISFRVNDTVFSVPENVPTAFLIRLLEAASLADRHTAK